ncbi:alpha/beta hydrolase [Siphonobacter sp. SORGH_AS_0500]|uniref:alpha/beta hydrolase n=1 Tax=Siphonobacter sp. SORGH_AS_0500 TaxID=1864824 RepID=UPI0012FE8B6C|nr:hypothetical protein [Siphonobacter sp. SORGH_AS_0500]MDR6193695.1 phospholipase/carboxylesterase [Siphonobacter sp. SORGH_AS_0500]
MNFTPLKYRFVAANEQAAQRYTLVLLHGTGGDENDLIHLAEELTEGQTNLLGFRGNVLENGYTTRFFRRMGTGIFDHADLHFRTEELVSSLQDIAGKLGFDQSKLIALGYSNGANIGGAILQKYPTLLSGAAFWRPMLPLPEEKPLESNKAPVLLTSGSSDPYYQPKAMKDYEHLLETAGFQVQHELIPSSHNLTQKDLQLTKEWLKKHFDI